MGYYFKRLIHEYLKAINRKVDMIMATQAELAQELTTVKDQVQKIGTETSTLIERITELEQAIANGPTTPEVDAALAALKAQVQVVDELVPDATP